MSAANSGTGGGGRAGRPLGFWMCTALVVGNTIGSGVFMLPAALAPFGRNGIAAWLFTSAGALLLAVVFARLSRAFPRDGGPYVYTRAAFGHLPAFVVAWGYWVSIWVGNAAIATAAVSYLGTLVPWMSARPDASPPITLAFVWLLTLVNWYGVRVAGWVQSVTTVLKLLPLMALTAAGVYSLRLDAVAQTAEVPLTLGHTTAAATLTLWALLGLEAATVPADKVADPARTIPRATLLGTALSALACALTCSIVLLVVPASQLAASHAPLADAARLFWGERWATLVTLGAAISAFGALNGWILLQGELPYAMAKDGVFPRAFARESSRGTPAFALVTTSLLVTLLVALNATGQTVEVFTFMILLATSATLVAYLASSLALLALLRRGRLSGVGRGTPWLAAAGALGAAYSLWAIVGAGAGAVKWALVFMAAAVPVYLLMAPEASGRARAFVWRSARRDEE